MICFDKQVHAAGKEATFQGRHSHDRIAVKLSSAIFAGIHDVVQKLEVRSGQKIPECLFFAELF